MRITASRWPPTSHGTTVAVPLSLPQLGAVMTSCRPVTVVATVTALAVSVFAGCASGDETSPESRSVTGRDSAAIRVVENAAPAWGTDSRWRVAPIPEVVIGASSSPMDDRDEVPLYRVQGARFLSDGRIVVANAGSSEVMVFDTAGTLVTRFGGRGEGPGELQSIVAVHVCGGDSIAVVDSRQTLHFFDRGGDVRAAVTVPRLGEGSAVALARSLDQLRASLAAAAHPDAPVGSSRPDRGCLCMGRLIL